MQTLLYLIAASALSFPWANPDWVRLTSEPIHLTREPVLLTLKKPVRVDDDYAHIQIDLGKNTPEIGDAILHKTFDRKPARGIHVSVCKSADDCTELEFKGLSFSKQWYDAGYFIPTSTRPGENFYLVKLWSESDLEVIAVNWVSGDTG